MEALIGNWTGVPAWVRLKAKLVWINLEQGLGPQSLDTPPLQKILQVGALSSDLQSGLPLPPPALCADPATHPALGSSRGLCPGAPILGGLAHPPGLQMVKSEAKGEPRGARDALPVL